MIKFLEIFLNMKMIDLRSDTVTLPSEEMLNAIQHAQLGDDVFGEDQTTNQLEALTANITDKESAMLLPSATMANLAAVLTHCQRGDEVILGDRSHTFIYEVGGISALGSVHPHPVKNQNDGTIKPEHLIAAIRPDNIHFPKTKLICLENTHNLCNGAPLPPDYHNEIAKIAKQHNLPIHLDGARLFNAAIALDIDIKDITKYADSVTLCLSKGLAAPVGAILCGKKDFIKRARKIRKTLGGAMRQTGIIAAPAIVALENMTEQIKIDHQNAKHLAIGLSEINNIAINPDEIKTNIVYFDLQVRSVTVGNFIAALENKGVKLMLISNNRFRMVTHYGIEKRHIDMAINAVKEILDLNIK